jgi:putative alpha-1,2-mannosidase
MVDVVHSVLGQRFGSSRGGLPGNDDSGGLSSWLVWNMLGLFPVAGQDLVLVGSPALGAVTVRLPGGDLHLRAEGAGRYLAGATLDGRELRAPWVSWSQLTRTRELRLRRSTTPTGWGADHRPPSYPIAPALAAAG